MQLNISQRGLILVGTPLLASLIFLIVFLILLNRAEYESWRDAQSKSMFEKVNRITGDLLSASQALGAYAILKEPSFEDQYGELVATLMKDVDSIRELELTTPTQRNNLAEVRDLAGRGLRFLEKTKTAIESEDKVMVFTHAGTLASDLNKVLKELSATMRKVNEQEARDDAEDQVLGRQSRQLGIYMIYLGFGATTLVAFGLAHFFIMSFVNRLGIMLNNTVRLGADKPLLPVQGGTDEIAQLDSVFHKMSESLAEARRRETAMIVQAVDVMCSLTKDGKFAELNPAVKKVWGYDPVDLENKSINTVVAENDLQSLEESLSQVKQGKQVASFEAQIVKQDGTALDTLWSATWSDSEQLVFCVAKDITERKELERLRRELLAMVSHDMRTPLTSIQLVHELILRGAVGDVSDKAREYLEQSSRTAEGLIDLVNDLLNMEKIDAGEMDISFGQVAVSTLFERTIEVVTPYAEKNSINLAIHPSLANVSADEDRIQQVLVNLITNSIKFSPKGSTITLSSRQVNQWVELRVSDQGRGIPEEFRAQIFNRFSQVEAADNRRKGGLGLGLSICKSIVEAHGGTIGVESEEGKGSTFWFRLKPADSAGNAPESA